MTADNDRQALIDIMSDDSTAGTTHEVVVDALRARAREDPGARSAVLDVIERFLSGMPSVSHSALAGAVRILASLVDDFVEACESLTRLLASDATPASTRAEVSAALRRRTRDDPDVVDAQIAASTDADKAVRLPATLALRNAPATAQVRAALEARQDDSSVEVKNEALKGLYSNPLRWTAQPDAEESSSERNASKPVDPAPDLPTPVTDLVARAERAAGEIRETAAELRDLDNTQLGHAALDLVLEIVDDTHMFVEQHVDATGTVVRPEAVDGWRTRVAILYKAAQILLTVNGARGLAQQLLGFIAAVGG